MRNPRETLPQIDRATSAAICNGIGERLQRLVRVETLPLSPRLQDLVEKLKRQEEPHTSS
jgi:hypothetical protein